MLSDRYLDPSSEWPQLVKELCKKTPPSTLTSWPLLFRPTSQHMVLSQETGGSDQGIRLTPSRQQEARTQQWRSRTPKHSLTCYLASSRQTSSSTRCPRCFKNGAAWIAKVMDFSSKTEIRGSRTRTSTSRPPKSGSCGLLSNSWDPRAARNRCIRTTRGVFWAHELNGRIAVYV
jgi:hypothetical protein